MTFHEIPQNSCTTNILVFFVSKRIVMPIVAIAVNYLNTVSIKNKVHCTIVHSETSTFFFGNKYSFTTSLPAVGPNRTGPFVYAIHRCRVFLLLQATVK